MTIVPNQCPICTSAAKVQEFTERTTVSCFRCGKFAITSTALKSAPSPSKDEIPKISGWIRENQDVTIRVENLLRIGELRMPSVGEKAERILMWLSHKCPIPGTAFVFQSQFNQPRYSGDDLLEMQAVGWTSDANESFEASLRGLAYYHRSQIGRKISRARDEHLTLPRSDRHG